MKAWVGLLLLAALPLRAAAPVKAPVRLKTGSTLTSPVPVLALSAESPLLALSPVVSVTPAALIPIVPFAPRAPKLIDTLSMEAPELSKLGEGEASARAGGDFEARAQLGGPGRSYAAASGGLGLSLPALQPFSAAQAPKAPGSRERGSVPAPDSDGSKMKALVAELASGERVPRALGFIPTPKSLRVLADIGSDGVTGRGFEVFLYRSKATGLWHAVSGDLHEVAGDFEDYDLALHNHVDLRLGAYSIYSPYPSPMDLLASAGKDARFFVVSKEGVVEWSSDTGHKDEASLRGALEGTLAARVVMKLTFPLFYPWLLGRSGVAAELKPWNKVTQDWLLHGKAPVNKQTLIRSVLTPLVADELDAVALRMRGLALTPEERASVLAMTSYKPVGWTSNFYNDITKDFSSSPDGVCWVDSRIELVLKNDWPSYASVTDHFRVLFTHEYAHRLQNEGLYTRRFGVEIPAVAVELLRAIELSGLDRLRRGHISFVGEGVLGAFDDGRAWAAGDRGETVGFFSKGFMAGVAYELARKTGRWDDAWEFVRRAGAQAASEEPAAVYAEILAR